MINLNLPRNFNAAGYFVDRNVAEGRGAKAAYDCEFVATANDLKLPFVTVDKRLLREFSSVAISLKSYCE